MENRKARRRTAIRDWVNALEEQRPYDINLGDAMNEVDAAHWNRDGLSFAEHRSRLLEIAVDHDGGFEPQSAVPEVVAPIVPPVTGDRCWPMHRERGTMQASWRKRIEREKDDD